MPGRTRVQRWVAPEGEIVDRQHVRRRADNRPDVRDAVQYIDPVAPQACRHECQLAENARGPLKAIPGGQRDQLDIVSPVGVSPKMSAGLPADIDDELDLRRDPA